MARTRTPADFSIEGTKNSFLLADRQEIWLIETAGRQWAARRIHDWAAFSNCYSLQGDYDLSSRDMESCARSRHWLSSKEPFDFAKGL